MENAVHAPPRGQCHTVLLPCVTVAESKVMSSAFVTTVLVAVCTTASMSQRPLKVHAFKSGVSFTA